MLKKVIIIVLISISPTVYSDWEFVSTVDSITDETNLIAMTTNKEGFSFGVYLIESFSGPCCPDIWGIFKIPNGNPDQIDPQRLIIFRIDKNEARDLTGLPRPESIAINKAIGKRRYEWEPKWLHFNIFSANRHRLSESGSKFGPQVTNLMEGEKLLVRYYLPTGGYEEVYFGLKGAKKAILQAIDIDTIEETPDEIRQRLLLKQISKENDRKWEKRLKKLNDKPWMRK